MVVPTGRYQNIMSVAVLRLARGKLLRLHAGKDGKTQALLTVLRIANAANAPQLATESRRHADSPGASVPA